ncbi:hypothetical protein KSP39_PZI019122 [Platanthera zijinensis]|uniref:Uncharacterized protein n=1 Tax=Platanthera zijinensis TaxID=2320716 RepID=A0AAP0B2B4_9ASPA
MIGLKPQIYYSCALWTGLLFSLKRRYQNESSENLDPEQNIIVTKYLLQKERHKQKTEALLESFRRSNFFVRIADSDEPLWYKRSIAEAPSTKSKMARGKVHSNVGDSKEECHNFISVVIDQGSFDCSASSGVARNNVRCFSLPSGDIVVNQKTVADSKGLGNSFCIVLPKEKFRPKRTPPCRRPLACGVKPPPPLLPPSVRCDSGAASFGVTPWKKVANPSV